MHWLDYLLEIDTVARFRQVVFTALTMLPINRPVTVVLPVGVTIIPFSLQKGEIFQMTCLLATSQSYQLYGTLSSAGVPGDFIVEFHPAQNSRPYQAPQKVAAIVVNQQVNPSRLTIWRLTTLPEYIGRFVRGWLR